MPIFVLTRFVLSRRYIRDYHDFCTAFGLEPLEWGSRDLYRCDIERGRPETLFTRARLVDVDAWIREHLPSG